MKSLFYFSQIWAVFFHLCFYTPIEAREDPIISSIIQTRTFQDVDSQPDSPKLWHKKLSSEEIAERYGADSAQKLQQSETPLQAMITLHTNGIQPGALYTLYRVDALLKKAAMANFVANHHGQLEAVKTSVPLSGYNIMQFDLMNGEPTYFVLEPHNKTKCLTTQVIVDPIEYEWEDGAYAAMLLLAVDACTFSLTAKGFQSNEELEVSSKSGSEEISSYIKTTSEGKLFSLFAPGVIGMKGGLATVTIKRKCTAEVGTLNYAWGSAAHIRAKGKKTDLQ